jgi:hypothetical protein
MELLIASTVMDDGVIGHLVLEEDYHKYYRFVGRYPMNTAHTSEYLVGFDDMDQNPISAVILTAFKKYGHCLVQHPPGGKVHYPLTDFITRKCASALNREVVYVQLDSQTRKRVYVNQ